MTTLRQSPTFDFPTKKNLSKDTDKRCGLKMLGHGGVTGGLFRVGAKKKVLPSGLRRCKPKTPKSSTREKVLFLKFLQKVFLSRN